MVGVTRPDAIPQAPERLQHFLADRRPWRHGLDGKRPRRGAAIRARCGRGCAPSSCSGSITARTRDPLAILRRRDRGAISVYAQGDDYHDIIKPRLKALARWLTAQAGGDVKVFVDTAAVMEKPLAAAAGLGWQGKHTNLVSRQFGSWLFLGAIFTTLDLPPDAPETDHCGSCRACLDVCPTAAFPAPYRLDARRCISYLTIEHKGPIPRELRAAIGNRIYGCDDCLAVCPWNKFAQAGHEMKLRRAHELRGSSPRRSRRPRRRRVPHDVLEVAGQAHRTRSLRAQRADRDRQFRRCDARTRGAAAARRCLRPGARRGGVGAQPPAPARTARRTRRRAPSPGARAAVEEEWTAALAATAA